MYTLVNLATGLVQEINLSKADFEAGNYKDAGKGLVGFYIESDINGTAIVGVSKLENKSWVNTTFDELKKERGRLLSESDWRATVDYPGEDQQAWLSYRRELRDIPQTYAKVTDVVMPTQP